MPGRVYTSFGALAKALDRFAGPDFSRSLRRPFSQELRLAERQLVRELRRRGVTAAIARKRRLREAKALPVRIQGGRLTGGLQLTGFAALQETGGKTRPHRITRRGGGLLVFRGRGGLVFVRQVRHPGSRIPKLEALAPAGARLARTIPPQLDAAIRARGDQVVG